MKTHSREPSRFASHPYSRAAEVRSGTLLWIGERRAPDFCDAYLHCEAASSQVAYRRDVAEAIARPAAGVASIVIARVDRSPWSDDSVADLVERHDSPSLLSLEGPLCAGESRRQPRRLAATIGYVHQWRQILPDWLEPTETRPPSSGDELAAEATLSLAVIASQCDSATMLMDLAASAGVAAVWFRLPSCYQMRNFDVVWWDDSTAGPVSANEWAKRLHPGSHRPFRHGANHVWITNSLSNEHIGAAQAAGVSTVLTKPFRLTSLLKTLSAPAAAEPELALAERSRFAA